MKHDAPAGITRRTSRGLAAGLAALALLAAACSPEAGRTQGGGPGADIGNRTPSVDLHGQTDMYYHTPALEPVPR
jgi:hypothetical protein